MLTSYVWMLLVLALYISDVSGNWQVINDDSKNNLDFNFQDEQLLPVVMPAKQIKTRQMGFSSVDQNGEQSNSHMTELKIKAENKNKAPIMANSDLKHKELVKSMALQYSTINHGGPSHKQEPSKIDNIDLASEELLSVQITNGQHSPNSRKLAQFQEQSSEDTSNGIIEQLRSDVEIQSQKHSSDGTRDLVFPDETMFEISPDTSQIDGGVNNAASINFQVACMDESSWECLMFKEDFFAMQGDLNLSQHATVHERAKRQSSSSYDNIQAVRSSGNSRNLLGCEDGDCFSGNGTITGWEEVSPDFKITSNTKTPTTYTKDNLTEDVKQKLVDELKQKLTEVYKDVPGFNGVDMDTSNVYIDTDGNIVYGGWKVAIAGGNGNFTGSDGPDVANKINDALQKAGNKYSNITIGGQSPIDKFNATKAVQDVEKQAEDPCKMTPSPCTFGYGSCSRLPADYADMTGIRLKCEDSCLSFGGCKNGECIKDKAGAAFCNCSTNWIGLFCDKKNIPESNKDEIKTIDYTVNMTTSFDSPRKSLTPQDQQDIANKFINQLIEVMKYIPGFKSIHVDPNNIKIENGHLVIPWNFTLDGGSSEFTGKTPQEIADLVKLGIQNANPGYRRNIEIDGQNPLEDMDPIDAANQVFEEAQNPCGQNPCSAGYGHCEALSPTTVKCINNCNARSGECSNSGKCQLDSLGLAVCQCTKNWKGDNCEVSDDKLDEGQIAGVVIGSVLAAAGLIGALLWCLLFARRNSNIDFTHYSDAEGSGSARLSNSSQHNFQIARPCVDTFPHPIHQPGEVAGGNGAANPFYYSNA